MPPLRISRSHAGRFMRRATLLDAPAADPAAVLAHLGYVQIDPINVCGRMHDLILRHRVIGYKEGDLMRHLHGAGAEPKSASDRAAIEHHLPAAHTLVALPATDWPHLLGQMRARAKRSGSWSGRLSPKQKNLADHLLAEIAKRGPLSSEDFAGSGRSRAVWGSATLAKATLQKLFFHGRLLIARRGEGNRRYYDLPERVLPSAVLGLPESSAEETARWEALLKLRQRRLVLLKRAELALVSDLVQPVHVHGCPLLHCLRSDLPLLSEIENQESKIENSTAPLLLAPLDPVIYDRRVTSALWQFDYTWEAYTPPSKRVRGHYALPALAGTEIVGFIDPKADRAAGRLRVQAAKLKRPHQRFATTRELAAFLGLR
jgi:hypothetical protein